MKDTEKESKICVCFLSLRLAIIYGNEELTIFTTIKQFSLSLFKQAVHAYLVRTVFVYIVLVCFYLNLLIFELAHSYMSFHKCWN